MLSSLVVVLLSAHMTTSLHISSCNDWRGLGESRAAVHPLLRFRGGKKHDCAQEATELFDNMRVPAALVAGSIVPLVSFAGPRHSAEDDPFTSIVKRLHFGVALAAFCSGLLSVTYATVAVNSLTESNVTVAQSVVEVRCFLLFFYLAGCTPNDGFSAKPCYA